MFCVIRNTLFFFILILPAPLPPSSFPSLLSLPTAGPCSELSAHPSFSRHLPLSPQSLPSSPFCASCFSFPSPSSSSPGWAAHFLQDMSASLTTTTPRLPFPLSLANKGSCKCMHVLHSPSVLLHLNGNLNFYPGFVFFILSWYFSFR